MRLDSMLGLCPIFLPAAHVEHLRVCMQQGLLDRRDAVVVLVSDEGRGPLREDDVRGVQREDVADGPLELILVDASHAALVESEAPLLRDGGLPEVAHDRGRRLGLLVREPNLHAGLGEGGLRCFHQASRGAEQVLRKVERLGSVVIDDDLGALECPRRPLVGHPAHWDDLKLPSVSERGDFWIVTVEHHVPLELGDLPPLLHGDAADDKVARGEREVLHPQALMLEEVRARTDDQAEVGAVCILERAHRLVERRVELGGAYEHEHGAAMLVLGEDEQAVVIARDHPRAVPQVLWLGVIPQLEVDWERILQRVAPPREQSVAELLAIFGLPLLADIGHPLLEDDFSHDQNLLQILL